MTFATFSNILVALLCIAVLVQSVRLMRSFRAVQEGGLKDMVTSLDRVTAQARAVLADLKETLATEGQANASAVARGEAIRDELSVMVGIGNAVAERIMDSAGVNPPPAAPEVKPAAAAKSKPRPARAKSQPAAKPRAAAIEAAR